MRDKDRARVLRAEASRCREQLRETSERLRAVNAEIALCDNDEKPRRRLELPEIASARTPQDRGVRVCERSPRSATGARSRGVSSGAFGTRLTKGFRVSTRLPVEPPASACDTGPVCEIQRTVLSNRWFDHAIIDADERLLFAWGVEGTLH